MKNVILTFDEQESPISTEILTEFISSHRAINSWLVPYRGTFLVKIEEDKFLDVYVSIRRILGQTHFIFAETNVELTAGILNNTMWDWINEGVMPPEKSEIFKERRIKAGSEEAREFEDEFRRRRISREDGESK